MLKILKNNFGPVAVYSYNCTGFLFIYAFMEVKLLGDKIEFLLKKQMYLAKDTACIENNDFEQALMYIKKIYATEKNYAINYFYAFILFSLERDEEALEVTDEYKELYLKSNEDRKSVV